MARYIGKKIGEFAIVLAIVSILIFCVIRLSSVDPGDRFKFCVNVKN